MTTRQLNSRSGVLVAIDVAEVRNEVLIEVRGQVRRRRLTVANARAEHERLVDLISGLGQPVTCAIEAKRQPDAETVGSLTRPAR